MTELLPWLNLLLLPAVGMLWRISAKFARIEARQEHHAETLQRLDSDVGDLRELVFRELRHAERA